MEWDTVDWYAYSDGNQTWLGADSDGDGYLDLFSDGQSVVHVDDAGLVDEWFVDTNGDATVDVALFDTDGDGAVDAYCEDADYDGYWDLPGQPLDSTDSTVWTTDPTGLDPWTLGGGFSPVDQQNIWGNIFANQSAMNDSMIWS
jgi:hypothetical protein